MRRLPILAALVLAALIAASAWLAIEAESDPEPLTTTEHLPRDDEQAQQAQAQSQPDEPDEPEDESESESSDQDSDSDQDAPAQSEEPASLEDGSDDQSGDAASDEHADAEQQEQSGQAEESATMSDEDIAERRLIKALDIDRRPHDQSAPAARQHTVEEGETLLGIADAYGVDIQRLLDDNDLALDAILHVGETLRVPSSFTYTPLQATPGPEPYSGGGLIWGTVTDMERDVIHSLVVGFIDHRAGLPGAPDLVIGCINRQLVVELSWQPAELSPPPADVRVYWRVNHGPLLTSRWTYAHGVLSAPDPESLIGSLHGALDLRLYPEAPDARFWFYWYPNVGQMVETPVQPNLNNCGR